MVYNARMLNLSTPMIVVLGALAGPAGADSPAHPAATPGHVRTLGQVMRGAPTPPPPALGAGQSVMRAPPPPPPEHVGPRPGFIWISGNYEGRGDRYAWAG